MNKMNASIATGLLLGLALAGCAERESSGTSSESRARIRIDGSSTVFPIGEAFAEEFQGLKQRTVRITVGISGTGGGFRKFCRGETDIQSASRPIVTEEMAQCAAAGLRYFELPIAFDAITVAVSPANQWLSSITVDQLNAIWSPSAQGKITRWNQVNPAWPDEEFALFGAGSDSGTFDYFTEAITGKARASRGDYTASEDDNVLVQGIETNRNALGYLPFSYYAPHTARLKALAIGSGDQAVLPSLGNVTNGSYQPLSRPLFLYVSEKAAERVEVREFIEFALTQGVPLIEEVYYLPLSSEAYAKAWANFTGGKLGTAFGGTPEVGLRVEDILEREASL
jgi:phosphate transport system substrate-binding protein